jgi:hypothetical protein
MDLGNNTITVEVEENNSLLEEYISYDNTGNALSTEISFFLKLFKPYLLSFDQIHPDQDLDPPDVLS